MIVKGNLTPLQPSSVLGYSAGNARFQVKSPEQWYTISCQNPKIFWGISLSARAELSENGCLPRIHSVCLQNNGEGTVEPCTCITRPWHFPKIFQENTPCKTRSRDGSVWSLLHSQDFSEYSERWSVLTSLLTQFWAQIWQNWEPN